MKLAQIIFICGLFSLIAMFRREVLMGDVDSLYFLLAGAVLVASGAFIIIRKNSRSTKA